MSANGRAMRIQAAGEPPEERAEAPEPTVVVALDGSQAGLAALPVARMLADLERASLYLVASSAAAALARAVGAAGPSAEQLRDATVTAPSGPPGATLLRVARSLGHPLVVTCPSASDTPGELDAATAEVLRRLPCPVVLVPPARGLAPWALRRVLLPHDGAPSTAIAARTGIHLAERSGAELDILYVATARPRHASEPGTLSAPRYLDEPYHAWPEWMRELLERTRYLTRCPTSLPTRVSFTPGDPRDAILRFGREHRSDLILAAWPGRLGGDGVEAIHAVVLDAPCPVLVARAARSERRPW